MNRFVCHTWIATALWFSAISLSASEPKEDLGIRQQDEATMQWFKDAKFGMFIHWGIYSVAARGEWFMENAAMLPEEYRKYASDPGDGVYFDAKNYDPAEWARMAEAAGMKYMCLTARHHDGFALFDSKHTNAFTSVQTLHRDLFAEYTKACRAAGLRLGLYYSPIDWRYPGYYDVAGTNCARNKWNYRTETWHKENARVMKEEVYEQVRTLFQNYGPFDYVFWDGGWLAQRGSDRDAAFFWEPGKFRDPNNDWQIAAECSDFDAAGRPLGLMGIARKYSPAVICNNRAGWIGDFDVEEGGREVKGPIRSNYWEKCLNLNPPMWGYSTNQHPLSYEEIVRYLVDVTTRNGNLLLNFGPDRHGTIPEAQVALMQRLGAWLKIVGDSFYGTRAGPWNPADGRYGFTRSAGKIFIHVLPGFADARIITAPLREKVRGCHDLFTGKKLEFTQTRDGAVQIDGIDRTTHPADTVIEISLDPEQTGR